MGTKIKCLKCGDIIEGDRLGHLISCKCEACYIDETPDYYRIGGDPSQIALIKEDGTEKILHVEVEEVSEKKEEKPIKNPESKVVFIFLDIDGVLNDQDYIEECYAKHGKPMSMCYVPFDPKTLNNLMILCQSLTNNNYDPKIILSSSWRLDDESTSIVKARLAEYGLRLTGKTEYINGDRGKEIQAFLLMNNDCWDFIILDDEEFDLKEIFPTELIQTNFKTGFDDEVLNKCLEYFKIERKLYENKKC